MSVGAAAIDLTISGGGAAHVNAGGAALVDSTGTAAVGAELGVAELLAGSGLNSTTVSVVPAQALTSSTDGTYTSAVTVSSNTVDLNSQDGASKAIIIAAADHGVTVEATDGSNLNEAVFAPGAAGITLTAKVGSISSILQMAPGGATTLVETGSSGGIVGLELSAAGTPFFESVATDPTTNTGYKFAFAAGSDGEFVATDATGDTIGGIDIPPTGNALGISVLGTSTFAQSLSPIVSGAPNTQVGSKLLYLAVETLTTSGSGFVCVIPMRNFSLARLDIECLARVEIAGSGNIAGDVFEQRGSAVVRCNGAGTVITPRGYNINAIMAGGVAIADTIATGNLAGTVIIGGAINAVIVELQLTAIFGTLGTVDCEMWVWATFD